MRKVLLTGAGGTIGSCLYEGLKKTGRYEIKAADLHEDRSRGIQAFDVTDKDKWVELTRGVDTILHFAWAKDEEDFLGKVLPINVTGAYYMYEAARVNGVRRVVFASSNHATGFYPTGTSITPESPYRPDSFYGVSKAYIELLGRFYTDKHGLESVNIRIGNFPSDNRPHSERSGHIWISNRDMVQLTERCMEAELKDKFLVLYGTSRNSDNYYDIGYLESLIGYKPQDDGEKLIEEAEARGQEVKQDETAFQGGGYTQKESK
ncbi:NAD(P)-dependent oxidoreductase [Paenibacillus aurantius]|uniref:NAD(P)-dependent oxidoreductase n=1 Tax=Paenibacillus aurantius TaxID=2918900 RepID=A0AA96RGD2_9BACL|nr:NAD(P)-dependent oxidoreductase [Paenibacillus aurantius]WNQ12401.1 NAD(P)-dependent oxidoreductase [Paenibacillus aurantius]